MLKISQLAKQVGLSRTALLYYEKLGLITGTRLENGYRVYSKRDLQRLKLIQKLLAAGLTLKECKVCLEAKLDRGLLKERLNALEEEISQKQQSRELLAAMLGEGDLKPWHEALNKQAPDAHLEWLINQGFNEKEALQLKWLSKDMNEHDVYMKDFLTVYETLDYWGPGSDKDTLKALAEVKTDLREILDIGSGKGMATLVLAEKTSANVTALDNEQSALDQLIKKSEKKGVSERMHTVNASMTELPFSHERFDLIWAESSAYIMGVESALKTWKPFLRQQGHLVLSDLVWRTEGPSSDSKTLWESEYPEIQTVETRLAQMARAGYRVVAHFPQSNEAWMNYFAPLAQRVTELAPIMPGSKALKDIKHEVDICTRYSHEFGYHMFVLAKAAK